MPLRLRTPEVLELVGVTKRYGDNVALDNVDVDIGAIGIHS